MNKRILAIDPSGTGTTGMFFKSSSEEQFISYQNPEWIKHYNFIAGMVKVYHPDILLYEHTNFISLRGKDMTSLLKLLGAIETLTLPCSVASPRIEAIPVNQVKELRAKLLKGETKITELEYKPGKGWYCHGKKISVHELDAYLVYWIWESKANNQLKSKPIGKSIANSKSKAKTKPKDIEEELLEDIDGWPEERECIDICYGPSDDDLHEEELEHECEDGCPSCCRFEESEDIDQETDHDTKW